MSTYTPVATINVTSTVSSVTFNSIPQTYNDLILVASVKSANNAAGIRYRLNGDSGSNYSQCTLTATGSVAGSERQSLTYGLLAYYGYTSTTEFGLYKCNFQNYSKTTTFKSSIGRSDNTSGAGLALLVNTWRNTSAITSLEIFLDTGNNIAAGSTFNLYGIVAGTPKANGGDIVTTDGTYWYHTFRSSGAFIPYEALTVDYLVVAGGGSGGREDFGSGIGGGGGAGGLRCTVGATGGGGSLESPLSLLDQPYIVTVGAGGASRTTGYYGNKGSDSTFATITSIGGGGGGGGFSGFVSGGQIGGSGGGGMGGSPYNVGGAGTANQGFAGGNSIGGSGGGTGGGGGAGEAGNTNGGAQGGDGVATSISGSSVTYAGGGGGALYGATSAGGAGGGGTGANYSVSAATNGTANTGGGGGGGANNSSPDTRTSGAGGSGIVIVRYAV